MRPARSEPSKIYWAVGIVGSLALHAGGVAGAVLLADRFAHSAAAPTEITFTDEASPVAAPVASQAESAAVSAAAATVEPESLAPTTAETATGQAAETLQPLETETAVLTDRETLAPSGPETATSLPAETAQPLETEVASIPATEQVAQPALEAAQPVEPDTASRETPPSLEPEAVEQGQTETVQSVELPETVPSDPQQDAAVAISDADRIATTEEAEPLPTTVSPVSPSSAAESAERIAALETPASVGTATPLTADQPASSAVERLPAETGSSSAPETLTSLQPETLQQDVQSVGSGTETTPTSPAPQEVLTPVTGSQNGESGGVTVPGGAETVRPIEESVETALLVPARPDSSLGTEIDKPTDRYRRIVDFIRQYSGGDCFIALPAMSPDGAVTFQTFGRDKAREDAFRQALVGLDGLRAEISTGNVDNAQCLALSFARAAKRYPGFSLMIDLHEADMASGAQLSGSVLNAGGRELHLLLVDNDGIVQSIDSYLSAGNGTDRPFSAPLVLTGGPVETKQILIAIATNDRLAALAGAINEPATSYFERLGKEIGQTGADIDLAVEGFSVR